jgi:opacity protein-like surface antigen
VNALLLVSLLATTAAAQQTQLDVHGNFSTTTQSHDQSWGAGIGPQFTFGSEQSPVRVSVSPGFDYLKQEHGGPSQESLSLDANLQPGGSSSLTPYVGASASTNWSSGTGKQWEGSRVGLETMGGLQFKTSPAVTLKAEERFGYIRGQEHSLTTRFGVLLGF